VVSSDKLCVQEVPDDVPLCPCVSHTIAIRRIFIETDMQGGAALFYKPSIGALSQYAWDKTEVGPEIGVAVESRECAAGRSERDLKNGHPRCPGVNELQVHQIELEMQNEELRRAQLDLVSAVERYSDLYEFAPSVTSRWIREVSSSRQTLRLKACWFRAREELNDSSILRFADNARVLCALAGRLR
jgi:hypothetical protein